MLCDLFAVFVNKLTYFLACRYDLFFKQAIDLRVYF